MDYKPELGPWYLWPAIIPVPQGAGIHLVSRPSKNNRGLVSEVYAPTVLIKLNQQFQKRIQL